MWGNRKVEKNKTVSGSTSRYGETSTEVSNNTIKQRSEIYTRQTSSTHSSETRVKQTITSSRLPSIGISPANNQKPSLPPASFSANVPSKMGSRSIFELDAKPFTPTSLGQTVLNQPIGYQSPFRRQIPPYRSARSSLPTVPRLVTSSTYSLPMAPTENIQNNNSVCPTYNTNGKRRGRVLLINNIKFLSKIEERKGAELDERCMFSMFEEMGFAVKVYRNLKKQAMHDKIKKFRSDSGLKEVDISLVIMMSHGNNSHIPGGFTQIFGTDGIGLPIDDVLNEFTSIKCPAMKGKPKIFVFQCCRGDGIETPHVDAVPIRSIVKDHADMLIAYSTLPGFSSLRDPKEGSWYIQCIYETFKQHAKQFDVETLLKIVDEKLSGKHPNYQQTSTYESRGFKRCFLNPI